MVKTLDDFAHDVPATPLTTSRDQFAERAYSLLTSSAAQAAFRIDDEPAAVRDKYGRTTVGQSCLLARRLVEAGVSFVTINDRGTGPLGWDTHVQNFPTIKNTLAPPLDKGVAALVEDLSERGLLDEHARRHDGRVRPDAQDQPQRRPRPSRPGQLASCSSARALPAGLVLGRTDASGDAPADRPVTPADLASVLYHKLGIDPETKYEAPDGRPIRLVDGVQSAAGTALKPLDRIEILEACAGLAASFGRLDQGKRLELAVDLEGQYPAPDHGSCHAHVAGLSVRQPDVDPLKIRLERAPADSRRLASHAAQVLCLAALGLVIAERRFLATDGALATHGNNSSLFRSFASAALPVKQREAVRQLSDRRYFLVFSFSFFARGL